MAAQNIIRMGPTRHAVAHAQDIASTFYMFITPATEKNHPREYKFMASRYGWPGTHNPAMLGRCKSTQES
jgi:hypothetical protein